MSDYITQFYTWTTGANLEAARLNGNISAITDALSSGTKDVNAKSLEIVGTSVINNSRELANITKATIDNLVINGNDISSSSGDITLTPLAGQDVVIDSHFEFDGAALTALTDNDTVITAYAGKNITIESVTFDGGVVAGVGDLTVDNININGDTINNTSGAITISTSSDGDINLTPNGTGEVNISGALNLGGELTMSGQPVFSVVSDSGQTFTSTEVVLDFSDANVEAEKGGDWFDEGTDDSKITPPSVGWYEILANINGVSSNNFSSVRLTCKRYNSSDSLQETMVFVSAAWGTAASTYGEGQITRMYINSGDYFKFEMYEYSGGYTCTITGVALKIHKMF